MTDLDRREVNQGGGRSMYAQVPRCFLSIAKELLFTPSWGSFVLGFFLFTTFLLTSTSSQERSIWRQSSFADFSSGEFPDGGATLYVSARGRVELTNRWDLNNDGYVDLILANTHDYNYGEPAYLYTLPKGAAQAKGPVQMPSSGGTVVALV